MRKLLVIGIGVGEPDWVTMRAVKALNEVDVFFVLDKGSATADLVNARQAICERYIREPGYRFVRVEDPPRDRVDPAYPQAVEDWRDQRSLVLEKVITAELGEDGRGGFLVWGDPSLYDGTIQVIESILARGQLELEYEVIPGVSTLEALAARHRITLNRVAGPVLVTPGRRLAHGLPSDVEDIVVMLDSELVCRAFADQDIDIYWGAYLGNEDEILVAGKLGEVIDDIERLRGEARRRKGWIMDSYLLRRNPR